jgi:dCMP deaminase
MNERQAKWDRRYVALAQHIAAWFKDPSTKVGCVLVRPDNTIAATGFNGFPPGHADDPHLCEDRNYKYQHVIHAEINAVNSLKELADGFTCYTSFFSMLP